MFLYTFQQNYSQRHPVTNMRRSVMVQLDSQFDQRTSGTLLACIRCSALRRTGRRPAYRGQRNPWNRPLDVMNKPYYFVHF